MQYRFLSTLHVKTIYTNSYIHKTAKSKLSLKAYTIKLDIKNLRL